MHRSYAPYPSESLTGAIDDRRPISRHLAEASNRRLRPMTPVPSGLHTAEAEFFSGRRSDVSCLPRGR